MITIGGFNQQNWKETTNHHGDMIGVFENGSDTTKMATNPYGEIMYKFFSVGV
jgi:hypothetical protein